MIPQITTWMGSEEGGFWAMPVFLFGLVLLPLIVSWVAGWAFLHRKKMASLFTGELLERVLPKGVRWRRAVRATLLLVSFFLLFIALAEPRYGKRVHLFAQKGVDMVLILDLSSSMDAKDVDPSRLERARREVTDLVALLEGDRVGLVIYAGGAYPRMPLTKDHQALQMLVSEVSTQDFQIQGSALGEAVQEAIKLLMNDNTSTAGKAIFVLSDGEVHDVAAAFEAGQKAVEERIQIYGLGIGFEPSPIPLENGGYLRDAKGEVVMTRPSSDVLIELARMTGGAFHESEASDADVRALYVDGIQRSLEAGMTGERQEVSWQSGYQWPLGIGFLLALTGAWLGEGRRLWGAAAALFLCVLSLPPEAMASDLSEGDAAYRSGNYAEAERVFSDLLMEQPDDVDLYGRLGASRYRNGDYDGAARAFQRKSVLEGDGNTETLFNLGNAYYQSGRIQDAIEQYDATLDLASDHPGATHNKQLAEQEIEARRAIQPPPESNESGEGDSEENNEEGGENKPSQQGSSPQQGEKEDQEGESEKGDEKKGDDQEGSSGSADVKEGPQSQQTGDGQEPTQKSEGEKSAGDEQEKEKGDETDSVDPNQLGGDEDGSEGSSQGGDTQEGNPSGLSEEAALDILESVEEGRPRVVIPGRSEGKPW